jgi:hypothetical protein
MPAIEFRPPALNPMRNATLHNFAAGSVACLKQGQGALQTAFNALKVNRFCNPADGTQVACEAAMQALEMK